MKKGRIVSIVAFYDVKSTLFHVYKRTVFEYFVGGGKRVVGSCKLGVFKRILTTVNAYSFCFLVRRDERGVDFGLWQRIPMSALYLPLDVHTGNMGRALGLLTRRQSDWKATVEITRSLREFCADDPVKYDYALFGAGIDGFLKE